MAYPLVRAVIRGQLTPSQSWSTHCDFGQIGSASVAQVDLDTWTTALASATNTLWTATGGLESLMNTTATITEVVSYYYASAGASPSLTSLKTLSVTAPTNTYANPLQVCIVASLLTGIPGRKNRGRMFIPAPSRAVSTSTGYLSSTVTSELATAVAAWISSMNGVALGTDAVGAGPMNSDDTYTTVRVDNRMDIQRRRADKAPATAFSTASI